MRLTALAVLSAAIGIAAAGGCDSRNGRADDAAPPPMRSAAKAGDAAQSPAPADEPQDDSLFPPPAEELPRRATDMTLPPELAQVFGQVQAGQFTLARMRASDYITQHPDDGRGHFLLGLTYHQEYRYGTARPHFEQAARLSPNYHPIWHFYGWCLYYLGEPALARRAFQTHLEYMPTEGDSHFAIGLLDLDDDDLDAAEQRFRKAIEHQANVPGREGPLANAHTRLGEVHARRGELEAAREQLETAIGIYPDQFQAMHQLYLVLQRLGQEDEAEAMLERYERTKQRLRPHESPPQQ